MYDSVASPEDSTFRACLLERCLAEENKIISGHETSEENMRGFAMFLAEIYTQLEDSQVGQSMMKQLLFLLYFILATYPLRFVRVRYRVLFCILF